MKKKGIILIITALLVAALISGCGSNLQLDGSSFRSEASIAGLFERLKSYYDFDFPTGALAVIDAEEYYETLLECRDEIRKISDFEPEIVIVLGSGLGDYADELDVIETIPYSDIEGWPHTTVPGHKGNLVFAEYKGLKLAVMQGRIHYYEGYSMDEVVAPLRVLHLLGAHTVILTNAVGAINTDYQVGDFVCVRDHISSFVPSPLLGENVEELGERFPGMTNAYDEAMQEMVLKTGEENGITVHSGVYLQVAGPHFESPAEIQMFKTLGADTVGMSSVVEAIAGVHMGMRVCDINCVTNMAAGIEEDFDHNTVSENAQTSAEDFTILLNGLLDKLAEE